MRLLQLVLLVCCPIVCFSQSKALTTELIASRLTAINSTPEVIIKDEESEAAQFKFKAEKLKAKLVINYTDASTLLVELAHATVKDTDANQIQTLLIEKQAILSDLERDYKEITAELSKALNN